MFNEYEIYGTSTCKWCDEAAKLLTEKGLRFKRLYIDKTPGLAEEFQELFPGRTSVPQILGWSFNGVVHHEAGGEYEDMESTHIGGYDDLKKLLK